jgi:hypothetical protein
VARLSPVEQLELYQWLQTFPEISRQTIEALRKEVMAGLEEADRGDLARLDVEAIKTEVRHHLSAIT